MYEKEINTVTKQWQQKSTVQLNKTAQDFFAPKKNILPSAENNNLIIGNIKENMQMKIANVVRRFNFGEWGGTETAVWNACKVLRANGNSPSIVSTVATGGKAEENVEGIPIRRFPYFYPHLFFGTQPKGGSRQKGRQSVFRANARLFNVAKFRHHTFARDGQNSQGGYSRCGKKRVFRRRYPSTADITTFLSQNLRKWRSR